MPPVSPRRSWPFRLSSALLAAAAFLFAGNPAQAVSFNIPQVCNGEASGSEDELDPVVLITHNAGRDFLYNFPVNRQQFTGQWYVTLQNLQSDDYFLATTYTPFLTSTLSVRLHQQPSQAVFLPPAGISQGSIWRIFPIYTVTVVDGTGLPIPGAMVDFIPAFTGSSPYTMQADGQGNIAIHCLQAENTGYAVTVYNNAGAYIADSGFLTDPSGRSNIVANAQVRGARPPSRTGRRR